MIFDSMKDCFASLNEKVFDAIETSDLENIFKTLDSIEGPTLVCGVGGSSVVGTFLAKVLREKKNDIVTFAFPRDIKYMNLSGYKNVIAISYSSSNVGVDVCFNNNLNKYLLSTKPRDGVNNMIYKMKQELSYVSIAATLVPLTIALLYYKNDLALVKEVLSNTITTDSCANRYEVMTGHETVTASIMLESCIVESGIGACVVHDKYNYCHGRINLSYFDKSDLIFFRMNNDLDSLFDEKLRSHFNKVITIDRKYDDNVINDYYATYLSLKLVESIAINKGLDFSDINYFEDNDLFYLFKGEM